MREWYASESPNLKSALEQPDIVTSKPNKEHTASRIAGNYLQLLVPSMLHLFPSFVVPIKA